jgi:hypothetical protein
LSTTVDDILDRIKLRSFAPISQNTFSDTDLLNLMYEELKLFVVPMILAEREDFFLVYQDDAITGSKDVYPVAERAAGTSLKSLWLMDDSKNPIFRIPRTTIDKLDGWATSGSPCAFYMRGSDVALVPAPSSTTGYLRQWFFQRPSAPVLVASCAKITAISTVGSTTTFTVDTDLTASLSVGDDVDFQCANSPYQLWDWDVAITAITSTTIAVANADVIDGTSSVLSQVGDYICPAKQSCFVQVPEEFHTVLAQKVVCTILGTSLGDQRKYQIAENELNMLKDGAIKTIQNRVESSPKKVNPRNSLMTAISSNSGYYRGKLISS